MSYSSDGSNQLERHIISFVENLSGRKKLQRIYDDMADVPLNGQNFWGAALDALDITLDANWDKLVDVPQTGPLVVIANHPFGVVDGLSLCHLTSKIRPDFKVILHKVLCQDTRVADHVLPIDFDGSREASKNNVRTKKQAEETLKNGGVVVIFPAGGVANASSPFAQATDIDWKPLTSKLIKRSGAAVLPIYFQGQNSWLYQCASKISNPLRLGLFTHEVRNKIGSTVKARIGQAIPYETLAKFEDHGSLCDHLRQACYQLGQ